MTDPPTGPRRSGSTRGELATIAGAAISPQDALPGLATAFDEEWMKHRLQVALFGADRPSHTVVRCTPTRPLYVPGESCVLRYRLGARDATSGALIEPIVMGRVFPDRATCAEYMSGKLAPLAARMRGRQEVAPFAAPAAMIDELGMVVHVWPIDGELPTLVDATDRRRMVDVLRETLPGSLMERSLVEDCEVALVSYRRRQRCVLRYTLILGRPRGDDTRRMVVYGKVSSVGDETLNSQVLLELRDRIAGPAALHRFTLPRPLGSRADLRLSLLDALPGQSLIGPAITARLRGRPAPGAVPLEDMIETSGRVAAMLHGSGVASGRPRALADELEGLRHQVAMAARFVPSFGDRAPAWLERIAALGSASDALESTLCHGDFKHEQLLFDGAGSGLVDFDALCQAEPALDLGKFLAHLRVEAERAQRGRSVSSTLADELAERFVRAYVGAARDRVDSERQLRSRTELYEAIALLRLALISQQDLDPPGMEMMGALLQKRLAAIAP